MRSGDELDEVGHDHAGEVGAGERVRLVAGQRQPDEGVVGVPGVHLDVAVPELAVAVEVHVVRGHDDRQPGGSSASVSPLVGTRVPREAGHGRWECRER